RRRPSPATSPAGSRRRWSPGPRRSWGRARPPRSPRRSWEPSAATASRSALRLEAVADPPHRPDLRASGPELLADARDVAVDGALLTLSLVGERRGRDLLTGERDATLGDEEREDVELVRGQLHGVPTHVDRASLQIHRDLIPAEGLPGLGFRDLQAHPDACHQLLHPEGFGEVIHGPQVEGAQPVPQLRARREDDDRRG